MPIYSPSSQFIRAPQLSEGLQSPGRFRYKSSGDLDPGEGRVRAYRYYFL